MERTFNRKEVEEMCKRAYLRGMSDSEKNNNLVQIIEDLYINWEINTLDVYIKKNKDKIINIINSKL
jgi:hypothetical protein